MDGTGQQDGQGQHGQGQQGGLLMRSVSTKDWNYVMQKNAEHLSGTHFDPLDTQAHSRQSSGNSATSDSSPISTTFSNRSRRSGSSSSLASTSPHLGNATDAFPITTKRSVAALPNVEEENESSNFDQSFTSTTSTSNPESLRGSDEFTWAPVRPTSFHHAPTEYDDKLYFPHERYVPAHSKSDEPTPAAIETPVNHHARLVSRLSSLKRRLSTKKGPSAFSDKQVDSPKILSRASSFRKSLPSRSKDSSFSSAADAHLPAAQIGTIVEDGDLMSSPTELYSLNETSYFESRDNTYGAVEDPIARSTTPLLPALMNDATAFEPVQSPLTSPSVAPFSMPATGPNSPMLRGPESPPLSTQVSMASFGRSRAPTLLSTAMEIPPLIIAAKLDPISNELGHADFDIVPRPYLPVVCDMDTINEMTQARLQARQQFEETLRGTEAHFGIDSKQYALSIRKWKEIIEPEWQACIEEAARKGHADGLIAMPMTPLEPAPITAEPVPEKDPKIYITEDILGPMAQVAPQPQPDESRKASIKRFFSWPASHNRFF